jgi:predicted XRE-type DNA-binding protein
MKLIPNFPGYFATEDGRIWSEQKGSGRFLKMQEDKDGYLYVTPCKHTKQFTRKVHRLILEAFIGPCPAGMECCHNNGDPSDNRLENLRYSSHSENIKDAFKHGTKNHSGEKNPHSKLNNLQVRIIKKLLRLNKLTQKEIANIFNVTQAHISRMNTNKI